MGGDDTASLQSPERETIGLIASALWFFLLGLGWRTKGIQCYCLEQRRSQRRPRPTKRQHSIVFYWVCLYIRIADVEHLEKSTHTYTHILHTYSQPLVRFH